MTPNVQDRVMDEVEITRTESKPRKSTEHHNFSTIESIGRRSKDDGWNQRIAAMVIALLICTALYGMLYLAMHVQE